MAEYKKKTAGNGTDAPKKRGRPSEYRPEYAKMLEEYAIRGYREDGKVIPTLPGFKIHYGLKFETDTFRKWKEIYPDFRQAFALLGDVYIDETENGCLSGKLDGTFGKFLLMAKFGYREKQEVDNTVTVKIDIPDEIKDECV